jgi:hypothetical protein
MGYVYRTIGDAETTKFLGLESDDLNWKTHIKGKVVPVTCHGGL